MFRLSAALTSVLLVALALSCRPPRPPTTTVALRSECRPCTAQTVGQTCIYAEGSCLCERNHLDWCGGVELTDDELEQRTVPFGYACSQRMTKGCPVVEPRDGTPCDQPAVTCVYYRCCTYEHTCHNGSWSSAGVANCPG